VHPEIVAGDAPGLAASEILELETVAEPEGTDLFDIAHLKPAIDVPGDASENIGDILTVTARELESQVPPLVQPGEEGPIKGGIFGSL
jgi:hypothetical protein